MGHASAGPFPLPSFSFSFSLYSVSVFEPLPSAPQPRTVLSQLPKIWIVCPCYFDVPLFLRVREAALAGLAAVQPARVSFLLVDDSAGLDPEVKASLAGLGDVRVIRPPYNLGHQGALVYGLRQAGPSISTEDIVITMDSDGEDRPEDIPALIAPLVGDLGRLDLIAVARRTQRTKTVVFQAFYFCFRTMFLIATGTVVRSGNFIAYRGWLLKDIIYHPHFDQCYSSAFISLPLNLEMVPLPRGQRTLGRSKMGFWGLFTHGIRMLMPFTEKIAIRGMFACSILGFAFLLLFAGAWIWGGACRSTWLLIGFTGFFSSLLLVGLHGLLFTTFSQTKSHSLRVLHDHDKIQ
jgi:polyisoprenyl-phosphate glycosyltransferase